MAGQGAHILLCCPLRGGQANDPKRALWFSHGSERLPSVGDAVTPTPKPTDTFRRVVRGGAWLGTTATFVRAAFRSVNAPTGRVSNIGFRCAQRGVRQPLKVQP